MHYFLFYGKLDKWVIVSKLNINFNEAILILSLTYVSFVEIKT